ncbi:MAG: 3-oxoacyl-[acyl-carrier-protein] reductase [Chitinophagales bacterium]|nr:3-oxoacyl-[acyl-carrier-protein] reductase [Chitinophagales bacterium]
MKLLQNQVALVTGGSRGIGKAICLALANSGANVAFTYHSSTASALELEKTLLALGIHAKAYQSDAADFSAAKSLTEAVIGDFGQIDILVNNAGVTRDTLMLRMTEEQWDTVMNNNLKSTFNLSKFVSQHMLKQRKGSIVNISSVIGLLGQAGQANYAASKAGIIGFSKSLADELGSRNVRCNVIAPGFIETEMTDSLPEELKTKYLAQIPMRRFAQANEVAQTVVFLGSDMSSYITGQTLAVCGGLTRY